MDEASRMARASEQGFDADVYHGTANDISAFDVSKRGGVTRARSARDAFWFTDHPETAGGYSEHAGSKPVQELIDQSYAAERRGDWDAANRLMAEAEALESAGGAGGENVLPLKLRGRFMEHDAEGQNAQQLGETGLHSLVRQAREQGYDGVRIANLDDNADWGSGRLATHYGVFDPANIRSRFAAFDPSRSNRRNLLAGLAVAAPVGAISLREALLDRSQL